MVIWERGNLPPVNPPCERDPKVFLSTREAVNETCAVVTRPSGRGAARVRECKNSSERGGLVQGHVARVQGKSLVKQ